MLTKEHIRMALLGHELKILIVITKVDLATEQKIKDVMAEVREYLHTISPEQIVLAVESDKEIPLVCRHILEEPIIPLVTLSCVSG